MDEDLLDYLDQAPLLKFIELYDLPVPMLNETLDVNQVDLEQEGYPSLEKILK